MIPDPDPPARKPSTQTPHFDPAPHAVTDQKGAGKFPPSRWDEALGNRGSDAAADKATCFHWRQCEPALVATSVTPQRRRGFDRAMIESASRNHKPVRPLRLAPGSFASAQTATRQSLPLNGAQR